MIRKITFPKDFRQSKKNYSIQTIVDMDYLGNLTEKITAGSGTYKGIFDGVLIFREVERGRNAARTENITGIL